ncbi:hypothetical protein [Peribacillus sp. SI8-4]|nr:hypothetical protein [Peribacillus sp. SI8-4]
MKVGIQAAIEGYPSARILDYHAIGWRIDKIGFHEGLIKRMVVYHY